jgi:hypothetical protein
VDVAEPEAGAPPPSLLAVPPPVATGAPSLRQLSTPDAFAEDQLTDQIDEVSAEEAGRRYGNRWLERIDPDVLARFLNTTKRPTVPPRIDKDLLGYLLARGIDHQGQDARRAARNGFWDALEATAATR